MKKHPNKDISKEVGMLIIITGRSGSGKDAVMNELLEHNLINQLCIKRVITCTDRPIRQEELPDAYHFMTPKDLDLMAERGELIEEITTTGSSRKATSKKEIARLLSGENLIWRIDPSRAADVATGNFFERNFSQNSKILKEHTLIFCINADKETIKSRRKKREGKNYNSKEFALRDKQEAPHIDILLKTSNIIENIDGKLTETTQSMVELITNHYEKIKKG